MAATTVGPYRVLQPGAVVGPASTFIATANGAGNEIAEWLAGANAYLGVRFWNEAASRTNYGYVRLRTTPPHGFPAHILGYCYNQAGGAITVR